MRTGLVIFGVIFIIIGGLIFFVPNQELSADTTTTDGNDVDTRTSTASINVPVQWAYASGLFGMILLIMGLAISGPTNKISTNDDTYEKVVETINKKDENDGNKLKFQKHKIIEHRSRR